MKIGEATLDDYDLARRRAHAADYVSARPTWPVAAATDQVLLACEDLRLVYTAFDGDHFQLCSHMRRHVISRGFIPANPESILGYKDVVTAHWEKREVLRDDLSILAGCDELWVFTEQPPTPLGVAELAEGVAIEILFFLSRMPRPKVRFVSPLALLDSGLSEPVNLQATFEDVLSAIPGQAASLLGFLEQVAPLRPLSYYIHDPLDFKYADWFRADAYSRRVVPLVPGLALSLMEVESAVCHWPEADPLCLALVAWAKLSWLARQAWRLPSLEPDRTPSFVAAVLESVFERRNGTGSVETRMWEQFPIPKVHSRASWALTEKERQPLR